MIGKYALVSPHAANACFVAGELHAHVGEFGVRAMLPDAEQLAGKPAVLAIRPEKLKVSRNAPTDATVNAAQGEIWDIGYLGDMTVFYVKLDSGKVVKASMLNAQREVENPIAYDEKVWVSFGETAGVVLKD